MGISSWCIVWDSLKGLSRGICRNLQCRLYLDAPFTWWVQLASSVSATTSHNKPQKAHDLADLPSPPSIQASYTPQTPRMDPIRRSEALKRPLVGFTAILYYIILYYTRLYYTVLYYYYTRLYIILHYTGGSLSCPEYWLGRRQDVLQLAGHGRLDAVRAAQNQNHRVNVLAPGSAVQYKYKYSIV